MSEEISKLTNLARYDKGVVRGETEITPEGYIKARAIVTRTGVFLYKNADGTIRNELRHPDDVLRIDSLESMKMVPVVNGHPPERLVNAENAKRLSVGYTGELVEQDMPYIIANLVITDEATVKQITDKKKSELSLGYTVDLIPESGTYHGEPYEYRQTNIMYNHLALVDMARAGPEARIQLDGDDAIEVSKKEACVAEKAKVKVDSEEKNIAHGMEEERRKHEEMKVAHDNLMKEHMALKDSHERMMAERDSLRDKDHHDPEAVHHPLEEDEIGSEGKEVDDPVDNYGMQSHVKDYEPPSKMENHVVMSPKNEHYPRDLPHIAKVDSAEVNRRVKERVKLEKLSEKYLDRATLARLDGLSDQEVKKRLIKALQPNANIEGRSETYINARFDAAVEDVPAAKVIAAPSQYNNDSGDPEKDNADANKARKNMIARQKVAYRGGK